MNAGAGPRFEVRVVDEVLAEDLIDMQSAAVKLILGLPSWNNVLSNYT